jgi:Family of unknown function (DUF6599)
MRRITIFIVSVLFLASVTAAAPQILPQSFGGWTATATFSGPPASGPDLPPNVLAEYGLRSTEQRSYRPLAGGGRLDVTLFQMKDPSGAYGLLSYFHPPDATRSNLASQHSFVSGDHAWMITGNVVIDVRGQDLRRNEKDLKQLLHQVSAHAEMGALPTLWQQLPAKGMVQGTDMYVLGPWTLNQYFPVALGDSLGFSTGAEAEVARYRSERGQATLLLVDLPTPQIATQTLSQLAGQFDVNGSKPGAGPALYAKRMITTLAIVAAPDGAQGRALLDEVQSAEVLTWNEPAPKGKQADIGTIVVGTIIGTGLICAFSIVAGLAFGGLRLALKRAMPGKIFDREKHLQVLQLGLSSKPISAEDFYDRSGPRIKMGPVEKNLPDKIALRLFR